MKYETPELTVLTPAINAIQGIKLQQDGDGSSKDPVVSYEDWE